MIAHVRACSPTFGENGYTVSAVTMRPEILCEKYTFDAKTEKTMFLPKRELSGQETCEIV